MEVKPLKTIGAPKYPAAEELAGAKALLSARVPRRWRKAKGLAGAIAVVLAANCAGGCGSDAANNVHQNPNAWRRGLSSSRIYLSQRDPLVLEAGEWIESIFRDKSVSVVRTAGDIIEPFPSVKEEEVKGILKENQDQKR